ncbi:hypothetical protein M527_12710 [Sphingobium indicum IP26]|nr:hypothetical protein M527_12710 [Sphingobium indicum IP26]
MRTTGSFSRQLDRPDHQDAGTTKSVNFVSDLAQLFWISARRCDLGLKITIF